MPDYMFLLESRLSPEQRAALERVKELAQVQELNVYLTGGAVRDLISGQPIRDLDFTIEGNPQRIVRERSGAFIARSTISGTDRLVSFTQIGELPLLVAISQAIDDVYAEWWRRAIAIGSVTLILAVTNILLAVMSRHAQRELAAVAVTVIRHVLLHV